MVDAARLWFWYIRNAWVRIPYYTLNIIYFKQLKMKRLFLALVMALVSVTMFSQVTISQEDYNKLSPEARSSIEKVTTKKAIEGELKEVSNYAYLGKEIGTAVNETLKAVEESVVRVSETDLGKTAITVVVWKLLYKEIAGAAVGIVLLIISIWAVWTGSSKFSKDQEAAGITRCVAAVVTFIASMACLFG